MVAFNSSVNPVIYAFYSGLFRQHLKNIICQVLVPRKVNALDHAQPVSATNGLTVRDAHATPVVKELKFTDVLVVESSRPKYIYNNNDNSDRVTPIGLMPLQ
jgi:hypothetical protein